jgi:hypothetical protein
MTVTALSFTRQDFGRLNGGDEQSLRQLAPLRLSLLQQPPGFHLSGLNLTDRHRLRTQDEATRGIHKSEKIKVAVGFGVDRNIVQLERDPGFVDAELIWVEH